MILPSFRRATGRLEEDAPLIDAVALFYPLLFLLYGFALERCNVGAVARGLWVIVREPDVLINDYIALAGLGAPFVNAGLCSLAAALVLRRYKAVVSGPALAAIFTIAGFSLFGKNIYNIAPVFLGVRLYALANRRPFSEYLIVALFGTGLSPLVSEVTFGLAESLGPASMPLGILAGIAVGFLLPPLAAHSLNFHQGYNLYNIGFTAGLVGTVAMSLFRAFGLIVSGGGSWAEGLGEIFIPFLILLFGSMIAWGWLIGPASLRNLRQIFATSGRIVTDFVRSFGLGPSLVNMGLVGLVGVLYVLLVGGDWNGPVMGALFTMCGFAAFGAHALNVLPVMAGVAAMALLSTYEISDKVPLLAALFGSTLAPLAGHYGPLAGFIAGAVHLSFASNVGYLHGGLNLYNNGFSGGLVAGIMVPLLEAARDRRRRGD